MTKEFNIKINNVIFSIEVVNNYGDLEKIKKLDDFVFGNHQGIEFKVLKSIYKQGGLLVYRHNSLIIGESQCILESIEPNIILEEDTALFYGTAVHPKFQGNKIGTALFKAQEKNAIDNGKRYVTLTVRPENNISILARLNMGFKIINYDNTYFGNDTLKDGRLILWKDLLSPRNKLSNCNFYKIQTVNIKVGNEPDINARKEIEKLFENGYLSTSYKMVNQVMAEMTFKKFNTHNRVDGSASKH